MLSFGRSDLAMVELCLLTGIPRVTVGPSTKTKELVKKLKTKISVEKKILRITEQPEIEKVVLSLLIEALWFQKCPCLIAKMIN